MPDHAPNFIHAADLHLGAPLDSLGGHLSHDPDKLSELRHLASKSFGNLVDLALQREAAFVVMAGDVYDHADREVSSQLSLERGLRRLAEDGASPIPVFVVHGNHDPLVAGFRGVATLPDNVHVFAAGTPTRRTVQVDGIGEVTVAGVSYSSGSESENLVQAVATLSIDTALPSVGVVHANVEGTTGHGPYAPCSRSDLEDSTIGYWALGHVHKRSVNAIGPGRWWAYPGNLQGRSTKPSECGAKGVLSVAIGEDGFGEPEFIECDSIRFERLAVDVADADDISEMVRKVAESATDLATEAGSRPVLVTVELVGRTGFHQDLRALGADGLAAQCREELGGALGAGAILRVRSSTRPDVDVDQLLRRGDLLSELLRFIDALEDRCDPDLDEWVATNLVPALDRKILGVIGERLKGGSGPAGQSICRELLAMSRNLLIDDLYGGGEQL